MPALRTVSLCLLHKRDLMAMHETPVSKGTMLLTEAGEKCAGQAALPPAQMEPMVADEELPLVEQFFPFGFRAELRTNSQSIVELYRDLWGRFYQEREAGSIQCDVRLVESAASDRPPDPRYRLMLPFMVGVADADNLCIVDLEQARARISLTPAAVSRPHYAQYFFLNMPLCSMATCFATSVHAACVSLNGRGVLFCGDSGAGKSTLAFACARSGWTYISDDGSYIVNGGECREVTGNCHQVRLRPAAARFFPELQGLDITPRAAGKPSIELATAPMTHIRCAQTTRVDFVLLLNRRADGPPDFRPVAPETAKKFLQQVHYGTTESLARQHREIDRLLTAEILEFRYSDLDSAVARLHRLVTTGR